ncbi:hypothetical protein [Desulfosporosinus nitroreducens]|uniref:hypothetical protein n=1 Tax=Desulfosporosinus nitroreducens TaxID=2018668 RepID=UPI00207D2DA3|nr:hypothetical protein [Desulfosporosinus nitroreducens]MCO1601468.1 hypothetical protein [Desulfosporosinus nitroreducens]
MKEEELKELFQYKVMTPKITTKRVNEPIRQMNLEKRNTVESHASFREGSAYGEAAKKEDPTVGKPENQEEKHNERVEQVYNTAKNSELNSKKVNRFITRFKSISNNVIKIFKL